LVAFGCWSSRQTLYHLSHSASPCFIGNNGTDGFWFLLHP
jgi:hypothetical protein